MLNNSRPAMGAALAALLTLSAGATQAAEVSIRRTADGIPHIKAANWRDLGLGYGYVQAQDALCTLSEAFVTYKGRRSLHWGADNRPEHESMLGRPTNLELDFFFAAYATEAMVAAYRRAQPVELQQLIGGFADGYNRYLGQARLARSDACASQAWVENITAGDIYRRMYAASISAGYARFIPAIANAAPPGAARAQAHPATRAAPGPTLAQTLAHTIGNQPGIGSNALALGGDVTGEAQSVLFGNPHWFWRGPDRFYQAHLSIPGKLNAAGVSFLGVPVLMVGFNDNVAWSHTVSEARRFGLFDLTLADPTHYRLDQDLVPMRAHTVTVPLRGADGQGDSATRTLYSSQYGPLLDLGVLAPELGWSAGKALALRDVNADNLRVFRTFFYWNQARSLQHFVEIQKREAGTPWVNTVAIGRGDARVWYADIGAVPNAPDRLRARCATPASKAFAAVDPLAPVLDGSRGDCNWLVDGAAAQPGALPASAQPGLFRTDYVANSNESYWLSNPAEPLEGYPLVMGGERQGVSLRGKIGHGIAAEMLAHAPLPAAEVVDSLKRQVLDARSLAAQLYKTPLLESICSQRVVKVERDSLTGKIFDAPRPVRLAQACRVLGGWNDSANAGERGALLWEQFWARVEKIPEAERFAVPFDPAHPLETPARIQAGDPRMATSLGAAVLAMTDAGQALDTLLGDSLYAGDGAAAAHVPLYGGCHQGGYYTVACRALGSRGVPPDFVGNSYVQVVRFGPGGAQADTLLAHGLRDTGLADVAGNSALQRYAAKQWQRFPFREAEIAAAVTSSTVLQP
ncbi:MULTISPECIES: penicillin acylase family protein [unclassified Janthinobacterium]|uniref:penicillin acylase family protein n=1 Tax=unclassified Janthinobacterium TaxID=2610881 RepID=UPI00034DF02D|nr:MULTISPECIES: penicillin acylase family protein [unclassified Janthinobacterium]MEC5161365.1 acyl-homoserine-lactone acylase [Janthinobacterium sp. CG_S6]